MLTLNLRKRERDGLLVRTVYPTVPPQAEYSLTSMARELHATLRGALASWVPRMVGVHVRGSVSGPAEAARLVGAVADAAELPVLPGDSNTVWADEGD